MASKIKIKILNLLLQANADRYRKRFDSTSSVSARIKLMQRALASSKDTRPVRRGTWRLALVYVFVDSIEQ
jgi:hypothetical protein